MGTYRDVDRRTFLKRTAAAGAAAALWAAPAQTQARASERVTLGIIGCGRIGAAHLDCLIRLRDRGLLNIAAVCDVLETRLGAARGRSGAKASRDFRRLLDSSEIDAVLIATPDRCHAPMAVAAADAGKDVYCENPMTHWKDLHHARDVVDAIARNRRVMQVGAGAISHGTCEEARSRIAEGELGDLIRGQACGLIDDRLSGGVSLFPELLGPLISVMGLTFPKRVLAAGGLYHAKQPRQLPGLSNLMIEYPSGPSIFVAAGLAGDAILPMQICGRLATLSFTEAGLVLQAPDRPPTRKPRPEVHGERVGSREEDWDDFLNSVRTRRKPRCHEVLGYRVMTALHLGVRSWLEGKVFEFDEEFQDLRAL